MFGSAAPSICKFLTAECYFCKKTVHIAKDCASLKLNKDLLRWKWKRVLLCDLSTFAKFWKVEANYVKIKDKVNVIDGKGLPMQLCSYQSASSIQKPVKKLNMQIKYLYGTKCCPICVCVWAFHMSISIWGVPYTYRPIYAYGAEHILYIVNHTRKNKLRKLPSLP